MSDGVKLLQKHRVPVYQFPESAARSLGALRKGMKWSDGHPFTAEDFRYWWEDVANNDDLSPSGPPRVLLVDDKPPQVEFIDNWTVRYTWDKPNPLFLPALAGASPLFIYRPAVASEDGMAELTHDFRQKVFGGSALAMVRCLVDADDITADEISELKKLINQYIKLIMQASGIKVMLNRN